MSIRISYIVDSFQMGGLERCVTRLINGLASAQFDPLVICLRTSGPAATWITRPDVPVIEIQRQPGTDWRAMGRLADALEREHVDVVHSHNWATLLETTLARRTARVPVHVHAQRGMFFHAGSGWLKSALRRQVTRWCINRAEQLVVVDESVKDYWQEQFGRTSTPVSVITNGVDIPPHDASGTIARNLRQALGIGPERVVVGSVGRLVPVKSFQTLIQAAAIGHQQHVPFDVVIVGSGPELDSLRAFSSEAGVEERIHLVGEQTNVGDWLKAMDVYVNCSLSEGMSQSVLEAMAIGLPMVVTDVGANRKLVAGQGNCGEVVPKDHPAALTNRLIELIQSPEQRKLLAGAAVVRHRQDYAVDRMIEDYASLYEHLMQQHAKPRRLAVAAR